MAPDPLLQLEEITAAYVRAGPPVLADLTMAVAPGEIVGLTGVSGCGKTTALRTIAGVIAPRGGKARRSPTVLRIAYCPQDDVLLDYRSVWENAALLLESPLVSAAELDAGRGRAGAALTVTGLSKVQGQLPNTLSGGMRQRLQVVQALAAGADLVLLDEPFAQQDLGHQRALESLMHQQLRDTEAAAVVVSHDVDALAAVCDRTIFLGGSPGRIVADVATPALLRARSGDARRAKPQFQRFAQRLWAARAEASAV